MTGLTVHPHLLYELSGQTARRRKRSRCRTARLLHHHTRMCPQSQAGTSTFWLDVVGSWWLEVSEGASVALGVRTPKSG